MSRWYSNIKLWQTPLWLIPIIQSMWKKAEEACLSCRCQGFWSQSKARCSRMQAMVWKCSLWDPSLKADWLLQPHPRVWPPCLWKQHGNTGARGFGLTESCGRREVERHRFSQIIRNSLKLPNCFGTRFKTSTISPGGSEPRVTLTRRSYGVEN